MGTAWRKLSPLSPVARTQQLLFGVSTNSPFPVCFRTLHVHQLNRQHFPKLALYYVESAAVVQQMQMQRCRGLPKSEVRVAIRCFHMWRLWAATDSTLRISTSAAQMSSAIAYFSSNGSVRYISKPVMKVDILTQSLPYNQLQVFADRNYCPTDVVSSQSSSWAADQFEQICQ